MKKGYGKEGKEGYPKVLLTLWEGSGRMEVKRTGTEECKWPRRARYAKEEIFAPRASWIVLRESRCQDLPASNLVKEAGIETGAGKSEK